MWLNYPHTHSYERLIFLRWIRKKIQKILIGIEGYQWNGKKGEPIKNLCFYSYLSANKLHGHIHLTKFQWIFRHLIFSLFFLLSLKTRKRLSPDSSERHTTIIIIVRNEHIVFTSIIDSSVHLITIKYFLDFVHSQFSREHCHTQHRAVIKRVHKGTSSVVNEWLMTNYVFNWN